MGERISTGLLSIIALGAGDGGAVANAITAFTQPTVGKRVVVRKVWWRNRTGGNANLLIGFGDRTVAGSLFRRVFPQILTLNGVDGGMEEGELPIMGNDIQGFFPNPVVPTGTTGNILIETDAAGVAVGTPLEVIMELELI